MEFMIFYAFFMVIANVSAAPLDNDQTVGLDGITTLCDSSTEDCPLIFNNNDTPSAPSVWTRRPMVAGLRTPSPSLS